MPSDPAPSQPPSPLANPDPWDLVAADYAVDVVPVFEPFSQEALRVAGVQPGMRIVDVAAGPGTLSLLAARNGAKVAALDFAPEMIAQLRARAAQAGLTDIEAEVGDGMALPYADVSFDAGFSMFGLMFFPDRAQGFRELHRVLVPKGRAVLSSWVPLDRSPYLSALFATIAELVPGPKGPPGFPLTDLATFEAEMRSGGFSDVTVREHSTVAEAPSMAALIDTMIRSNAPVALLRRRLGSGWAAVESQLRERLTRRFGEGPQRLEMIANLAVGTRY